ncbi:MAG: alpha/beta fold hydrolase [Patescibacteria group bacterium]
MKKITYIIPGYEESHLAQSGYRKIAKLFEARGILPVQVPMRWKKKGAEGFDAYTAQLLNMYEKKKDDEVYILGFSFGAMIAFLTAAKTKPKALILCSLSPYFKEDLKGLKPEWVRWWKRKFKNEYSFATLAPKIKSKTYLIVGDKESSFCIKRVQAAKRQLANSHMITAKGAKHNINQRTYLSAIKKIVSKL